MTRYRLEPSRAQEEILLRHCSDARYVWNLCVEQESWWRRDRGKMPGWAERCRRLTEARADNPWLAGGSVTVQQQAVRDHGQAMARFFAGTHRRPRWRKKGRGRGIPDHPRQTVPCPPAQPQPRRRVRPESRVGAVPLVASRPPQT